MKKFIFLLLCCLLYGSAFAKDINYEAALFPDGLPIKTNLFGVTQKPIFKLHSEIKSPHQDNISFISYSVEEKTDSADNLFSIYLAIVLVDKDKLNVLYTEEITKYFKTFVEMPGNFANIDVVFDIYKITGKAYGLHVNIWSVISGSGSTSSSSDLFFSIENNFKIRLILSLTTTNSFSKMREGLLESKNSYLFYGDMDGNGSSEIVVLETNYKIDDSKSLYEFKFSPQLAVYSFNGMEYISLKTNNANLFENKGLSDLKKFNSSTKITFSNLPEQIVKFFKKIDNQR